MTDNLGDRYVALYETVLTQCAQRLQTYISSILEDVDRIDSVSARAKTPERFAAKALKHDPTTKELKYSDPLNQIQDQVGARITVLYLSDVEVIKNVIDHYFHAIEQQSKQPEQDDAFGYFGNHYILRFPDDAVPDGAEDLAPKFFELQIKTIFQHAWSECHHDIGYKSPRELTALEKRQMAFSAAQSWGADQIFLNLAKSLVPQPNNDA